MILQLLHHPRINMHMLNAVILNAVMLSSIIKHM